MKNKKIVILFIVWIAFIWLNSLIPADGSSEISSSLSYQIYEFLHLSIDFDLFHHLIRKCAHFTEYTILGVIGWFCVTKENRVKMIFVCIIVACLDETIQLFVEGRSGQVSDVMLDSLGVMFGSLVCLLMNRIRKNV